MKVKRNLKYVFFLLFIGFVGFLYSFTTTRNTTKKVAEIEVKFLEGNNNFLTHSMVNKLLIQNDSNMVKSAKSVIDLYKLEQQVSKNPYVEESAVFLTIDGVLKTTIKQRIPVARIIAKDSSYYIDKEGVNIPLSTVFSARVVLVSGVVKDEVKLVLPLIKLILKDDFLQKEIVGITKSNTNEYQFSVRSGDYKIDFGKLENVAVKFTKLKAFYNTTFRNKKIQEYKSINVKYHNQVVCTK
ncbi:cell division protein FtsQ [uncultured Polaribacter sp.]|uniref:cell division protein FtsQ/DivIB n=1 Tax=uncultured Polaribacter sp. TaxID=174711 RepID=UPI002613FF51|nr:cell division protein FtsQ [uncultured Polaribacter sp.]